METALLEMSTIAAVVGVRLFTAAVQGSLIIVLVWIVCRCAPALPPAARTWLWWVAALKLILALVAIPAIPAIPLPLLRGDLPPDVASASSAPPTPSAGALVRTTAVAAAEARPEARGGLNVAFLVAAAAAVWAMVVIWHAGRLVTAITRLRRAAARATALTGAAAERAHRLLVEAGEAHRTQVRLTHDVEAPQVFGVRRPVVLVPASLLATMSLRELEMALCHELMHVRRRDLLLGWVPAIAERLFFFHPLARLAAREYLVSREAACDAAVITRLGAEPHEYGRLLVRLGVAPRETALAATGASATTSMLRRRIVMLQNVNGFRLSVPGRLALVGLVALALLPVRLVAQNSATTASEVESTQTVGVIDESAAPAPAAQPARPIRNGAPVPVMPAAPAQRPEVPAQVPMPVAVEAPAPRTPQVPAPAPVAAVAPAPARLSAAQAPAPAPAPQTDAMRTLIEARLAYEEAKARYEGLLAAEQAAAASKLAESQRARLDRTQALAEAREELVAAEMRIGRLQEQLARAQSVRQVSRAEAQAGAEATARLERMLEMQTMLLQRTLEDLARQREALAALRRELTGEPRRGSPEPPAPKPDF